MQSSTRAALLLATAAVAHWACSSAGDRSAAPPPAPRPASRVVATFDGRIDAATGALTITHAPATSAALEGLVPHAPWSDGRPGSGPENTFELRNGTTAGAGAACPVGAASWEGQVVLTSFFDAQAFSDVAVELVSVTAGNEACDDDAGYGGMSSTYGLWSYGPIGVAGSATATATRTWRFAYPASQNFTFRGRIMATAAAIPAPANGATSFEWAPYMFADVPHAFQHQGTTRAHVVWDGTRFVDLLGALEFLPRGAAAADHEVGIAYPAQRWAGPFASGANRYEAVDTLGLTGDFTVCVKFKPGADPAVGDRKVLLAKGSPVDAVGYGWALAQQHGETQQYGIWYNSPGQTGNYDTFRFPETDHPERSTFDYVCGGRDGALVRVVNHGRDVRFPLTVGGPLATPDTLPLVIGAQADGSWPADDAGVYEVVFDSRGATTEVMADIVGRAEGRRLHNGAAYWGNDADARPVVGADAVTYRFPLGATAPVSSDGSGLLDAGTIVEFGGTSRSLGGTLPGSPTSYCVGAEVTSASWPSAAGCVLGDADGYLKLFFRDASEVAATTGRDQWPAAGGDKTAWAAGSRHTFVVCTPGASPDTAALYVDGTLVDTSSASGPQSDLTTGRLLVGTCAFGNGDLTGARVGRVFACPTSDPAQCE